MQIRIAPLYEKESGAHGEERKKKLLSLFLCLVILWCFVSSSLQSDPPFPPFKQPRPGCWERERENHSRSFATNFHVWPKTGHKFIQIPLEFTPDLLFKKITPVRQTLNVVFFAPSIMSCTISVGRWRLARLKPIKRELNEYRLMQDQPVVHKGTRMKQFFFF